MNRSITHLPTSSLAFYLIGLVAAALAVSTAHVLDDDEDNEQASKAKPQVRGH